MKGFAPLLRKELLEQRRTWRFLAMALVFTLVAVLVPLIARIVVAARDAEAGDPTARDILHAVGGGVVPGLGTFLAIIVAMGALAGERASGTAAMTLSKPVTRSAFVLSKSLAVAVGIFSAVAFASLVTYLLTLALFGDGGAARFAVGTVIVAAYLLFVSSVTLFWSASFARPLLAGGIAFATIIIIQSFQGVPHAARYLPIMAAEYGSSMMAARTSDAWPAFGIACGLVVLLTLGAWLIFRRKEL